MNTNLSSFTDILGDEIPNSQPLSLPSSVESQYREDCIILDRNFQQQPAKGTGQYGKFRSVEEIGSRYRDVFIYPFFNIVQSSVIDDALYSDKSMVVCAPTGSGKTVIFEMAIVKLLMDLETRDSTEDFKIIYMAPVKALCTERLTEWYSKYNKLGLLCIEVTGDTNVDFNQLQPYKIIITTPEKWDMLTRRWRDHRGLVEMIKLFLIDEVHILNDEARGPVLEAVVSRMKTVESSAQSAHRIEKLQKQYQQNIDCVLLSPSKVISPPRIRFVAVSATVNNPEDVAAWLGTPDKQAVCYKFGDECRPVKLRRVVEGYPCADGTSIFKFDIILSYKIWAIIQKYHNGKPTLIFCNTRKSVLLTAETLSREITITFNPEQKTKLIALASTIKNKKLQSLALAGVGCHHAGMLYEERFNIEQAFRNRDLPILVTTTTLAMGVNLPAHLVIIKNTQQYVNGAYQEYSISTVLQMVGRAGRPQFDTEATAVIMTRQKDKARYQALVGGSEPLQSYLHKRLAENLNSEAALGTVGDVAQCVQWLRSTFLYVRAAKDPKRYLGLPSAAPAQQISKKIEEMCVRAMNSLATSGLIMMDEASCIESTEAGRLMSVYYLDLETMKLIMKIKGNESLENLLSIICESHELADMHLRVDERRCLNALNRNNAAATIRFPMKGKINSRQMKLNCIIQAVLGCLPIADPSLNQEAIKVMRIAGRICKCLVAYVTRLEVISQQRECFSAVLNSIILAKCVEAQLWENSPFVSKQFKGIGPTFSTLLATAGKVNIMLLEESHPRDLERIMNKGPPAGNFLKKQISLLPKYQLTMAAIDERKVSVKLILLNQSYLAENMENLTAGDSHKCYVVAGDSQNHVLLLATFKDKDFISVYDGTITYEIVRKHDFEHKIFIHCISSTFAGIDVQCEYLFMSLLPSISWLSNTPSKYLNEEITAKKQTNYLKDRKRKLNGEITQTKEKKKRDNALVERLRVLKESFTKASNQIKNIQQKTDSALEPVHNNVTILCQSNKKVTIEKFCHKTISDYTYDVDDSFNEDILDSEKIDNILNEIECEISSNIPHKTHKEDTANRNIDIYNEKQNKNFGSAEKNYIKRKNVPKSNYTFLELLEKNTTFSDEDEPPIKKNGFSDAIKLHVEQYLQEFNKKSATFDLGIQEIYNEENIQNKINFILNKDSNTLNLHHDTIIRNPNFLKVDSLKDRDDENLNTKNNIIFEPLPSAFSEHDYKNNKLRLSNGNTITSESTQGINYKPIIETDQTVSTLDFSEHLNSTFRLRNELHEFQTGSNKELQFYATGKIQNDFNKSISNLYDIREKAIGNNTLNVLLQDEEISENSISIPIEKQKKPCTEISNYENYSEVGKSNMIQNNTCLSPVVKTKLNYFKKYLPESTIKNVEFSEQSEMVRPTCEYSSSLNLSLKSNPSEEQTSEHKISEKRKKYSFSTEQTKVHTKFAADHEICIIRTLKLDLDVTEIIHEKKNPKNSENIHNMDPLKIQNNLYSELKQLNSDRSTEQSQNFYKESANAINTLDFIDDNIIHKNASEDKNKDKLISNQIFEQPKISNDTIESILQKYSKVMRNSFIKDVQPNKGNLQNLNANRKSKSRFQSKKPFKISELPYIDIPLLNLCDPPKSDNTWNEDSVMNKIKKKATTTLIDHDKNDDKPLVYTTLHETTLNHDEEYPILPHINEISQADINIDCSMLDPKTLLERFNKYDGTEIIPPPPEFSDDKYNYSPNYKDESNMSFISQNCSFELKESPRKENIQEGSYLSSILQKRPYVETSLTPSTGVETFVDRNPMQSNTVQNWHYFQNNDYSVSIPTNSSRQGKLKQFKFVSKNKFKL